MTCPVPVLQTEQELDALLAVYHALAPRRVLEIGALLGGTLWHWLRETPAGAQMAVIDLPVPPADPRHKQQMAGHNGLWQQWAAEAGQALTIIAGSSQDARARLPFDEVDFLFIDGDHSYAGVKADWQQYAPLVRAGGIVALHDIGMAEDSGYHGPAKLWKEIKRGRQTEEWIAEKGWHGIGVVYVD